MEGGPPSPSPASMRRLLDGQSSGVVSPPDESAESPVPEDFGGEQDFEPTAVVTSLLVPVSVTMLLVVLLVTSMRGASQQIQGAFSELMVYQEAEEDSVGTIASGVLLNGLIIVLMLS